MWTGVSVEQKNVLGRLQYLLTTPLYLRTWKFAKGLLALQPLAASVLSDYFKTRGETFISNTNISKGGE